ncbi:hypothetical protein [Burkholderia lata]|uniref:hypothetical protein n=1 Tax=Burkholderia lata (strain ATCC 17760 / DSM 23089 / LMG 22485 / NCIMB 9086 / R18194 / 383) TaxID=482957 RepID=UPI0012EA57AB|nr:hypothetical protein [Burkholderia lata]
MEIVAFAGDDQGTNNEKRAPVRPRKLLVFLEVAKVPLLTILRRQTYAKTYASSPRNSSVN